MLNRHKVTEKGVEFNNEKCKLDAKQPGENKTCQKCYYLNNKPGYKGNIYNLYTEFFGKCLS